METHNELNTYKKYCPNVFLAKCPQSHKKGEVIILTTRHGKENPSIVHNLIFERDGFYYYSITREDGFNAQTRAEKKAEKYEAWAAARERKSTEFYEASQEGRDFLSLGEPIKVGHHSEKRHRALIERNHARMAKSVENQDQADKWAQKAKYWANRTDIINLSMPESIEFFKYKLEEAEKTHAYLKANPDKRPHAYALTYAKKDVNKFKKNLKMAQKLWN